MLRSADGRRLVVVGTDGITLRDAGDLRALDRFGLPGGTESLTPSYLDGLTTSSPYALNGRGNKLAIGGADGSLRLLDLGTRAVTVAAGRHDAAISDARFSADGRWLITTADDGDVIVWDVAHAAAGETLSGHVGFVFSPMITRDARTLYTASLGGTVFMWDLAGDRRLGRPFRAGARALLEAPFALSHDGTVIATGQHDGAISIVDARTLARRGTFRVTPNPVSRIVFVPGSHLMAVANASGFLALVDADSGRVVRRLRGHRDFIVTPGVSADGSLLATGSVDGEVRLWSLPDGRALGPALRPSGGVYDAQLSPDGRRLAVVVFARPDVPETLEVWDVRRRLRVETVRVPVGTSSTRFSPDGGRVAVFSNSGTAQVWSTATWKPITRTFAGHSAPIVGAACSRDGRTLATGSLDGTVRLWDVASQQAVGAPLPGVPNRGVVPFFTPDGARLLAGSDTGRAYLWDIRPESLSRQACRVAGRRLTRAEWSELLPRRDYAPAC